MRPIVYLFLLLHVLAGAVPASADSSSSLPAISQRDFALKLINALQRQDGLPEKPTDNDLLAVLSGKRVYKFEAEDVYTARYDNVAVRTFDLYGPFSGSGWVSGVAVPTTTRLQIFVPLAGEYLLVAAARGDAQTWSLGGTSLTVTTGNRIQEAKVGPVRLGAGHHDVIVSIPPEGAVDAFTLKAHSLPALAPVEGWRFDAPVTRRMVSEIVVQLLELEEKIPVDTTITPTRIEPVAVTTLPPTATTTSTGYLGRYFSKKWIRATYDTAPLVIPLVVEKDGLYGISVNYLGTTVSADLDGEPVIVAGKPHFSSVDLGAHWLRAGKHRLAFTLFPSDGIDVIDVVPRSSLPEDFLRTAGIDGPPEGTINSAEADTLITRMIDRLKQRTPAYSR